jgi:hypothetical protein
VIASAQKWVILYKSFMKTLKHEEIYVRGYRTMADVIAHLPTFLESTDNDHRLHSALGYPSPSAFEAAHTASTGQNAPADALAGRGPAICATRDQKLAAARAARRAVQRATAVTSALHCSSPAPSHSRGTGTILVTTNKPLAAWGQVLHDGDLADAIIDRLLEHGTHFELRGRSYRTRHLHPEALPVPPAPLAEGARIWRNGVPEFRELTRLFPAAAFVGLICTLLIQGSELRLQRKELSLTCEELSLMRNELASQGATLTLPRIETSFFDLLGALGHKGFDPSWALAS